MIDRAIVYRLIGAGIMLLSAAIVLPLLLDGERPAELEVKVNVTEPPAFPAVKIAPVQSGEGLLAESQKMQRAGSRKSASTGTDNTRVEQIKLIPVPKKAHESISIPKAESKNIVVKKLVKKAMRAVTPAERWTVQIASFKGKSNATGLVDKLKKANYDAYSITTGPLYKVYIGPEFKRSTSEAIRNEVKKKFGLVGIVVRFSVN